MSDKQPRNNYVENKEIIHYALWGLFNLFYPVNLSLKEGAPIGDFIFNKKNSKFICLYPGFCRGWAKSYREYNVPGTFLLQGYHLPVLFVSLFFVPV